MQHLIIPFPDFRLGDIIDPDQFDENNDYMAMKVNELVDFINILTGYNAQPNDPSGSSLITVTPSLPFTTTNIQAYFDEIITYLKSSEGSNLIGSPALIKLAGSTVKDQLKSLDDLLQTAYVVTSSIANGAVTTEKLASLAITTDKIANLSITNPKLAEGAVGSSKLATGAVTNDKISDGAVSVRTLDEYLKNNLPENVLSALITDHIENKTERKHINYVYEIPQDLGGLGFVVKTDGSHPDTPGQITVDNVIEYVEDMLDDVHDDTMAIVNDAIDDIREDVDQQVSGAIVDINANVVGLINQAEIRINGNVSTQIANTTVDLENYVDDELSLLENGLISTNNFLEDRGYTVPKALSSSANPNDIINTGFYSYTHSSPIISGLPLGTYLLEHLSNGIISVQKFTLTNTSVNTHYTRTKNTGVSTSWSTIKQVPTEVLSDLQTTAKGNLVSAINEVKLLANDIKTKWANVIGASPTDTSAQLESKSNASKIKISRKFSGAGYYAPDNSSLEHLGNVAEQVTIQQSNSGQVTVGGFTNLFRTVDGNEYYNLPFITITGLTFRPRAVNIVLISGENSSTVWVDSGNNVIDNGILMAARSAASITQTGVYNIALDGASAYIANDGFKLPVGASGIYAWHAWN